MSLDLFRAIKVFTSVVELGSFAQAADRLDMSRAMASHVVAQLESHLRTRLLQRTTRRLSLTEEGREYFCRCQDILVQVEEAAAAASDATQTPHGVLRVNTAAALPYFLDLHKVVNEYLVRHPHASVHVVLADHYVNLVEEGVDLALRVTENVEPNLVARKLARVRMLACASPSFVQRHGMPRHPKDLSMLSCLTFPHGRWRDRWEFQKGRERIAVSVSGRLRAGGGVLLARAAQQGLGIVAEPEPVVFQGLRDGSLVQILPDWEIPPMSLYAVYPQRRHLPAKVQRFIELLREHVQDPPYWERRA
jgi:DNA-binding transcriptional LysR family regulator